MRRKILSLTLSAAMAVSVALVGASMAQAADPNPDAWGYNSTPKNADGSLDFTGWNNLGSPAAGTVLGSLSFTRNGLDYTIKVQAPPSLSYNFRANLDDPPVPFGPMLVANIVVNNTDGISYEYSYEQGSGESSTAMYYDNSRGGILPVPSLTFYMKQIDGALAVAMTGMATVDGADSPQIRYTEVLDVTSEGQLIHNTIFTNTSGSVLPSIGFSAGLDTMLSSSNGVSNDEIPIVANSTNSVYIDNGDFRLYLEMLKGDSMVAGDWGDMRSQGGYLNVNGTPAGQDIIDHVDTAIVYNLNRTDLQPGTSVSLSYQERLLAPSELVPQHVNINYVDDDANGAAVSPASGAITTLTGMPGETIPFTPDAAEAAVPTNYTLSAIDTTNAVRYDINPNTDQVITVHFAHMQAETGTLETTRTIVYSGAGAQTPASVVQSQSWMVLTDQVNGSISYVSSQGYDAVASPTVAGYAADPKEVPATAAARTTTKPVDETVTVKYTVSVQTGGAALQAGPGSAGALALLLVAAGAAVAGFTKRSRV